MSGSALMVRMPSQSCPRLAIMLDAELVRMYLFSTKIQTIKKRVLAYENNLPYVMT